MRGFSLVDDVRHHLQHLGFVVAGAEFIGGDPQQGDAEGGSLRGMHVVIDPPVQPVLNPRRLAAHPGFDRCRLIHRYLPALARVRRACIIPIMEVAAVAVQPFGLEVGFWHLVRF